MDTTTPLDPALARRIADLRSLLDYVEANPELFDKYALPSVGIVVTSWVWEWQHDDPAAEFAHRARLLGGERTKRPRDDYMVVSRQFGSNRVDVTVSRDVVCEKVVTVETVEVTEPDPVALAAVPTVTRTEQRERVEWVCAPVLGHTGGLADARAALAATAHARVDVTL